MGLRNGKDCRCASAKAVPRLGVFNRKMQQDSLVPSGVLPNVFFIFSASMSSFCGVTRPLLAPEDPLSALATFRSRTPSLCVVGTPRVLILNEYSGVDVRLGVPLRYAVVVYRPLEFAEVEGEYCRLEDFMNE